MTDILMRPVVRLQVALAELREREDQLRRIHVPLLLFQDRIVDRGIGRVAVEDGLSRREIREPNVPGEEAFGGAQRDQADQQHRCDEHEGNRAQTGSRRRRGLLGPGSGGVGGRPHALMVEAWPEGVVQPMV